ncbi:hypothetical protein ACHAXN_013220 [Cyclotella atomus]
MNQTHPSLKGYRFVIFPEKASTQFWDLLIIGFTVYNAFFIPYQFGMSGGYYKMTSDLFVVFSFVVDLIFFVDTFLQFFRAYYDKKGYLIYNLSTIRKTYIRSGWFFINLLSSIPTSLLVWAAAGIEDQDDFNEDFTGWDRALMVLDVFKLLRLFRLKRLMKTSSVVDSYWERMNVMATSEYSFEFLYYSTKHWIACIWGVVAFIEAGLSFGEPLLTTTNWISNWYNASYVEGGLQPIGFDHSWDRYFLCLFWSVQSITSIGYGNIVPVTLIEYVVSDFLMLICGIFWAYIIGSFVSALASMGSVQEEYQRRLNQANQMIGDFMHQDQTISEVDQSYKNTSSRVKRFLTRQRDTTTKKWLDDKAAPTLMDRYPTLEILSPGLQSYCALHLLSPLIEKVPYLSLKHLSREEQAEVAMKTVNLEFSPGERFTHHSELGRGILIFLQGFGMSSRDIDHLSPTWRRCCHTSDPEVKEVLVEDDYYNGMSMVIHFISFSRCLFIPRSAIMDVLERNPVAWRKSARWHYFQGCLIRFYLNELAKDAFNNSEEMV